MHVHQMLTVHHHEYMQAHILRWQSSARRDGLTVIIADAVTGKELRVGRIVIIRLGVADLIRRVFHHLICVVFWF